MARRFVIGGRTKVGFLESSLRRFVTAHRAQVERGSRFRQLTEAERDEIIRRARRMALVRPGQAGLVEIARRIARKMSRSTETIRLTLKAHDRDHPDRAIFPNALPPLDDDAKAQIYRRFRMGVSAEVLARQYGRTRSSIYRLINEMRAERHPGDQARIHRPRELRRSRRPPRSWAPMPEPADGKAPRRPKAPKGLPPYLASLYEVPLLDREQEMHLFRKMNYLKHQAIRLRDRRSIPAGPRPPTSTRSNGFRKKRWRSRTRSSAPTCGWWSRSPSGTSGPSNNFFELVSDGNMSLIRAVEKFDFSRGNKFSTYASWAIMKNFARTIPEENYRRDRFVTGHEEMFEAAADNRTDEHEYESALKRMQEAVKGMLGRLDERERQDHHQPLRPRRRQRADTRTARPRTRHHQGTRPSDRVARPGKAPQDRRRGKARLADALTRVRAVAGHDPSLFERPCRTNHGRYLPMRALDHELTQIGPGALAAGGGLVMIFDLCRAPSWRPRPIPPKFFRECGKALQHAWKRYIRKFHGPGCWRSSIGRASVL